MKLIKVPIEEAVDGEEYLTEMKHGWISGAWIAEEEICMGYYWHDLEWAPYALYRMVKENEDV